jgi:hypothetical protein
MIALALAAGLVGPGHFLPLPPRACNAGMLHASADPALLMRPQDWSAARPRKLGELPDASHEYAVLRLVGGCMVPAPIGYHPRPGR